MILAGLVSTDVYGTTPDWLTQRAPDKVKFADPAFTARPRQVRRPRGEGLHGQDERVPRLRGDRAGVPRRQGRDVPDGQLVRRQRRLASSTTSTVGVFNFPTDDGKLVVPAYTGGGMIVSAKAANLDAARKFALAFQLDKTSWTRRSRPTACSRRSRATRRRPASARCSRPVTTSTSRPSQQNAVVHAFRWETADDGLLPGMTDKVDAGRPGPDHRPEDRRRGRRVPGHRVGEGGLTSLTAVASHRGAARHPPRRPPAAAPPAGPAAGSRTSRRSARPGCSSTCASCWRRSLMSFGYSLTNYNPFNPPTRFVGLRQLPAAVHRRAVPHRAARSPRS